MGFTIKLIGFSCNCSHHPILCNNQILMFAYEKWRWNHTLTMKNGSIIWLVVKKPSWNIWVRQWEGLSHILWKIKMFETTTFVTFGARAALVGRRQPFNCGPTKPLTRLTVQAGQFPCLPAERCGWNLCHPKIEIAPMNHGHGNKHSVTSQPRRIDNTQYKNRICMTGMRGYANPDHYEENKLHCKPGTACTLGTPQWRCNPQKAGYGHKSHPPTENSTGQHWRHVPSR